MPAYKTFISIIALGAFMFAQAAAGPALQERNPRYRLQPNDVVEVQYRYTPEYNGTVSVEPDGFVSLQLVGEVKIGGLTLEEASGAIVAKANTRLKDPEVTVLLKDFVKPKITVAGEVNRPGTLEIRGGMTAIEAIALSGGFKDSAKHSQVILLRRIDPEMAEVKIIDIKKAMTAEGIREDISLRPGDMLVVPQSMVAKIDRYVKWATVALYGIRGIVP
ncbi:MAG: polysaccharide biosynthesis/export family protein [Bryobacteraceae bacterium]